MTLPASLSMNKRVRFDGQEAEGERISKRIKSEDKACHPPRDISDRDLAHLMSTLNKTSREANVPVEPIQLVVVGDQNVGKSLVLNRLIGHNVLPVRTNDQQLGAKTFCPTVYHTQDDADIRGAVQIWRGGKQEDKRTRSCEEKDVDKLIEGLHSFVDTGRQSQPAIQWVDIHFMAPNTKEIHFVDLPGIRHDDAQFSTQVKGMIRQNVGRKKTILVFVMRCGDPHTSSVWEEIRNHPPENVIVILTRPDSLNDKDLSQIKILEGESNLRIPKENIFLVRNMDTSDGKTKFDVKTASHYEEEWFRGHPLYSQYIDREGYSSQFGIDNVWRRINVKLRQKLSEQMPSLMATYVKTLDERKFQLRRLGPRVVIEEKSRVSMYYKYVTEFKGLLKATLEGKGQVDSVQLIKKMLERFQVECSKIRYNQGVGEKGLNDRLSRSGGAGYKLFGHGEEVIDVLFKGPRSPFASLLTLIDKFIDETFEHFQRAVADLQPEDSLDPKFWDEVKKLIRSTFSKDEVKKMMDYFCRPLPHNFTDYEGKNLSTVQILSEHWESILREVQAHFPKCVLHYMIEGNLNKLDELFQRNATVLAKQMREEPSREAERQTLEEQISGLETTLEVLDGVGSQLDG